MSRSSAGLPPPVIARAEEVLDALEKGGEAERVARLADDLPLFARARPKGGATARESAGPSEAEKALAALNPDELSPRDALEALYRLRGMLPQRDSTLSGVARTHTTAAPGRPVPKS